MKKKVISLFVLVFAGLMVGVGPAMAGGDDHHKVTICHAVEGKGQNGNGFNTITIDVNGAQFEGHDGHSSDVIPAFGSYSGKNLSTTYGWGFTGQQLLDNNCKTPKKPNPEPEPPVEEPEEPEVPEEPEYVTVFTPEFNVTCEAATFSHPAFKGGFGIPIEYLLFVGTNQGEAQASTPVVYTPGDIYTHVFTDKYASNDIYFELKAKYEGLSFQHQLGQRKGTSEPCALPEQPADIVEAGSWVTGEYVCGDVTVNETREVSTATHTWNGSEWVAGEPVVTIETRTRDLTSEEIEALDCPLPPVKEETLPETGGDILGMGALAVGLMTLGGLALRRSFRATV